MEGNAREVMKICMSMVSNDRKVRRGRARVECVEPRGRRKYLENLGACFVTRYSPAGAGRPARRDVEKKNASEEENKIGTNPVLTVYRYSLRVWHFRPSIHEFVSLFPPGWGDYPLWMKRRAERSSAEPRVGNDQSVDRASLGLPETNDQRSGDNESAVEQIVDARASACRVASSGPSRAHGTRRDDTASAEFTAREVGRRSRVAHASRSTTGPSRRISMGLTGR